jgi:predicted pyridoxine 5'-phosphate oxidase superfamily flavin-nucleotide-binding protein
VDTPNPIPGWTAAESPFHAGEIAVQDRIGVREQIDVRVRRAGIRDYVPDQHRRFFAELPFIVVACAEEGDPKPSVSLLVASPGFATTPDLRTLRLEAPLLPGSPLAGRLNVGSFIGALGIQFTTRRRNRVNGVVAARDDRAWMIAVSQSFGNCAKYIQRREGFSIVARSITAPDAVREGTVLAATDRRLIESADTLFIATANLDPSAGLARGVDVSHRGGRPGFVRVDDDRTLIMPEFVGNSYFNTLGNLLENPNAALLFVDFASGDLLHVGCEGEILWEGNQLNAFDGAQRLVRFRIRDVRRTIGTVTIDGAVPQYAPELARTGTWKGVVDRR